MSPKPVSMITEVSGNFSRKVSSSHRPSLPGIFMSEITSGVSSAEAISTAISAPAAITQS